MKEFRQKKRSGLRKFILQEDHINVEVKSAKGSARYNVKLHDLGSELHYYSVNTSMRPIYILSIVILCLIGIVYVMDEKKESTLAIGFLGILLIIIFTLGFLRESIDDVYLVGGSKNLQFYRNVPDEKTVLEFIKDIESAQKLLFKKNYTIYNSHTSYEEYEARLLWLKNTNVIDAEEYGQLLHDFEINRLLS